MRYFRIKAQEWDEDWSEDLYLEVRVDIGAGILRVERIVEREKPE